MESTDTTSIAAVTAQIRATAAKRERLLVLVDGPPGAGKTTFALRLAELIACTVFHVDAARHGIAPDLAWIDAYVVAPFTKGRRITMIDRSRTRKVKPEQVLVLEGVDAFAIATDRIRVLHIWVTAEPEALASRIAARPYGPQEEIDDWIARCTSDPPTAPGMIVVDGSEVWQSAAAPGHSP